MLSTWAGGNVGAGEAVEFGNMVRSAKAMMPLRPTFTNHGVGLGVPAGGAGVQLPDQLGYPAILISSSPPSSYTAKAYLPITALGVGAVAGP